MNAQIEKLFDLDISDLVKLIEDSNKLLNKYYAENEALNLKYILLDKENKALKQQKGKMCDAVADCILFIKELSDKIKEDKAAANKLSRIIYKLKNVLQVELKTVIQK